MPVIYSNVNVDERYFKGFAPTLYTNSWMLPGISCNDEYQRDGAAGGYYVRKLNISDNNGPTAPGADFNHKNSGASLIQIVLNNGYTESENIPEAVAANVEAPLATARLEANVQVVRQRSERSGISCLYAEGTKDTTGEVTEENVKNVLLDERQAVSESNGEANVILAAPHVYTALLKSAGKEFFQNTNEKIITTGRVGDWFGFKVFEVNAFANPLAVPYIYNNYAGETKTLAAADVKKINFMMYDWRTFAKLTNLRMYRLKDSEDFNGVRAQTEVVCGFRVIEKGLVRVHTTV